MNKTKKLLLIALLALLVSVGGIIYEKMPRTPLASLTPQHAMASTTFSTLGGYAWSSNIGWIHFSNVPTYAVTFDNSTGVLQGYAWSSNIGWISFNRSDSGTPPANPFQSASYNAQIQTNGDVWGWARAISQTSGTDTGTWDGWVALGGTADPNNTGYGVFQNGCNFQGYAWGGDVVGWMSFFSPPYTSTTPTYAVSILNCNPPTLDPNSLSVSPTYCSATDTETFSWTINSSSTQTAYELQVAPASGSFSSPKYDSGKVASGSISPTISFSAMSLQYGVTYQWRVRIWDQNNVVSIWYTGTNFTTASHYYPKGVSAFTWSPNPIQRSQPAVFNASNVTCYTTGNTATSCSNYSWMFDGNGPFSTSASTYSYNFTTFGTHSFELTVTDPSNYSCSATQNQNVYLAYPQYKEIHP